jgi:hypothetical protein
MVTLDKVKAMTRDKNCIEAMATLFEAMAFCDVVSDIVKPQQQKIIDKYKFKVEAEWLEKGRTSETILKESDMYLSSQKDFSIYLKEMAKFYDSKGFKVSSPGNDYLLEAEELVRDAQREACKILAPFTGIELKSILYSLKGYKQYIELNLSFFAPIIKNRY